MIFKKETKMPTLKQEIENEYGSRMLPLLQTDFNTIEATTWYLKKHQRTYQKNKIKQILNQFIDAHITNQDDINTGNPLTGMVDTCFEAWWKDQPAARSFAEQEAEAISSPDGYCEDPIKRVLRIQDDIEMNEQIYANQNPQQQNGFKANNTMLIQKLLSTPRDMRTVFQGTFQGVTNGQLPDKLEASGILDKTMRNRVLKNLQNMCSNPDDVTDLTDNELPLSPYTVAHWVNDNLHREMVFMQDSKTWYYEQNNKYSTVPDYHKGNPLTCLLEKYYDLCDDWRNTYPLFSKTISSAKAQLQLHDQSLRQLIGTIETHAEAEFNENVLTTGHFCTPHGSYNYLNKENDSNGLTKVTTNANIREDLTTDEQIKNSTGARLFCEFMTEIQPDQETRDYLMNVIADAIAGNREHEYTYILHGPTGANGKSVLMALLQHMLGDYYADYNTDSLVRHSYGETPEQAAKNLENRRLVGGREIGDGSTIDGGAFKRYFSHDSYTINEKYKPSYSVMPTHTMFLPVNQMPNFGSDPAIRRRLVVIPFTEHFVDNPDPSNPHEHQLNPNTLKNLIAYQDDIFTYIVWWANKMRILRENGHVFTIPQTVQHYGDMIVDETNVLADFVEREAMILTSEEMKAEDIPTPVVTGKELYERYRAALPQGTYNPYKTYLTFRRAFLLKYPQLESKDSRAYTTDGKQEYVIKGVWLKPSTTAALKLAKNRIDDTGMPVSFPTFKVNVEYEDWLLKQQQYGE